MNGNPDVKTVVLDTSTFEIRPATREDIEPMVKPAKAAGLIGFDSPNIEYFGAWHVSGGGPELICGMAGIHWYANKAVMKNLFIEPVYRGIGLGTALWDRRVEEVRLRGVPMIEGTATAAGLPRWLELGATKHREFKGDKNGKWTLVRLPV